MSRELTAADRANIAWANEEIARHLDKLGRTFPLMPQRTVIVRDATNPDRYLLLTNEAEDVADRLREVIAPTQEPETRS